MVLSRSSAAAATLAKRWCSSSISQQCAGRLQAGSSSSSIRYALAASTVARNPSTYQSVFANNDHTGCTIRSFSSVPPPPAANGPTTTPPPSITPEAGLAAQDAMKLIIEHGIGKQHLEHIAAQKENKPLVDRWQQMVAVYLQTQIAVIALLGYHPNEHGIAMYTQQLMSSFKSSPDADLQERFRISGRDTYRLVLGTAFNLPNLLEEREENGELDIAEARSLMHKVSVKMQSPEVLESVAKKCATTTTMSNDSPEAKNFELTRKHTVVQQVMVHDVYMALDPVTGKTLVEECGFGEGELGYVRMQSALAEHQGDTLITQYIQVAMIQLLQSAGIDMLAMQRGEA